MATPVDSFYTSVINLSGAERSFGFLGKHGKRLAAFEQYTVPGNLVDQIAKSKRKFQGLERAVDQGDLAIIKTPAIFVSDTTNHQTKALKLTGGTLGIADPSWGAYDGDLTAAFTPIADTSSAVATATLTFTAPVTGFSIADVSLTRGGTPVAITNATAASSDGGITWTISGLAAYTATVGNYIIKCTAAASGIVDSYGNPLSADATEPWVKS